MKKRWEDDDENQDDNLFPDVEGEGSDEERALNAEYIMVLKKREEVEAFKLNLIQKQLNYDVLRKTIAYLEKSWFWKFKSRQKKLDLVVETYQIFKALVDIDFLSQEEDNANV